MHAWLPYALATLVVFGFWGFFPKLATTHIKPGSAIVWEVLGALTVGIVAAGILKFRPETHWKGALFAFLTGISGTLGVMFFFFAVNRGKASVVVTLTALYPVVTILLAFLLLEEAISLKQGVGIGFALVAMVLFTL